ncbi:MAG: flippase-like domain-containing protein [bacterium]|nr:flippase-like domain-containing protein [bacterium]
MDRPHLPRGGRDRGHLRGRRRHYRLGRPPGPAGRLPRPLAGPAGRLSLANYLLRFLRWEIFLRRLDVHLGLRPSLILYFSSYLMVITPGKIGEVFKAGLLRERFAVPLARGVPIVLAERIYDFLGVLLLAAVGLTFWPGPLAA